MKEKIPWHRLHPLIDEDYINARIDEMGAIAAVRHNDDRPIFLRINDGAGKFANRFEDAARRSGLEFDTASITVKSMNGLEQGAHIVTKQYEGPDPTGREIIILEDIVDTGETIDFLLKELEKLSPTIIRTIALFSKPDSHKFEVDLEDVGFDVCGFVVGFNLDWDNRYREALGLWLVKFFPKNPIELFKFLYPKMPVRKVSPLTC